MSSQAERRAATIAAILGASRTLFTEKGFEATSIDDIAAAARIAKGAVYHHFDSKEAIFIRVLDAVQAEIAALPIPSSARKLTEPLDVIHAALLRYLLAASAPNAKQILLIDGPAVLGWLRWREIDDRYFGEGARRAVARLLERGASDAEIDAHTHLLMGAIMECALVCATAPDPRRSARTLAAALRRMLAGLVPAT
jgi:AcrR family transcriptional regulator